MEDLVIFIIYMGFLFGFVGICALLAWLAEKWPLLNRFIEWMLDRMEL